MTEIDYALPFRRVTNHPLPLNEAIAEILASLQREILSQFVHNFMTVLEQEGYQFYDVLDCLASYAYLRPELGEVCKCLENAVEAGIKASKNPPTEVSDDD
jgi:hypothetical protein